MAGDLAREIELDRDEDAEDVHCDVICSVGFCFVETSSICFSSTGTVDVGN